MWRKNKSFSLFNLISNHSLLLQISKCRALRGFWCNICLKNWGCVILFWQMSSLTICWTGCRVLPLRMLSTWVWPRYFPRCFPTVLLLPTGNVTSKILKRDFFAQKQQLWQACLGAGGVSNCLLQADNSWKSLQDTHFTFIIHLTISDLFTFFMKGNSLKQTKFPPPGRLSQSLWGELYCTETPARRWWGCDQSSKQPEFLSEHWLIVYTLTYPFAAGQICICI